MSQSNISEGGFAPFYEKRPSSLHGIGLFAKRDIPAGTKLCKWVGIDMSIKDFKERYGSDWRYVYKRMNWQPVSVAKDCRELNDITYVNDGHYKSIDPHNNCILKRLWLETIELVPKDTELTLKYHKNYNFEVTD